MTIEQFNKKYENLKIDYPNIFNFNKIIRMELLEDDNILKIINEYKESNINLEKEIIFKKY